MDHLAGLLRDGCDDVRMCVPRGIDGDAGGEVEEQVAVDVLDRQPLGTDRHDGVGAGQAR